MGISEKTHFKILCFVIYMIFRRSELWINGAYIFFIISEELDQEDELRRAARLPCKQLLSSRWRIFYT